MYLFIDSVEVCLDIGGLGVQCIYLISNEVYTFGSMNWQEFLDDQGSLTLSGV